MQHSKPFNIRNQAIVLVHPRAMGYISFPLRQIHFDTLRVNLHSFGKQRNISQDFTFNFLHIFDMKSIVKCWKDFQWYFATLKTNRVLAFPFVYQFYSRIEALVSSSFANDQFKRIPASFQHHFKVCLLWLLHEKECSFCTYLFCCTEMT